MKTRKNILKEAVVLLIVAVMVLSTITVTANTEKTVNEIMKPIPLNREILFQDDFESYADFLIDFPPWTNIDVDGASTFGSNLNDWPNENTPQAFIIFNPSMTTPAWTDPNIQPHGGAKFAGCFNDNNSGYISDDWLITPLLGPVNYDDVSFWAKSFNNQYNLERFEVGISTTDTNPFSFTIISPPPYVVPPYQTWTQYSYNLDNYDNQAIYIGIHMMSADSWCFMVDDFQVTSSVYVPVPEISCEGTLLWEKAKSGATVNGTIAVSNSGEAGSQLNWEVDSYPTWGTWTFTPESGTGLADGDSVTITVEVVAPAQKKKTFTGIVKMINSDDPTDFCEIDVSLTTPRTKTGFNLLEWILQRYPNMFPLLRNILA